MKKLKRAKRISGFQRRMNADRSVAQDVSRLRFRMAMRTATRENPRRGAPIAKHFHKAFDHDGVYMMSIPAFGIDAYTMFVVRAGALYGVATEHLDDPLSLVNMLRDNRVHIKAIA